MPIVWVLSILISYCVLVWFIPGWLHLTGGSVWVLRGGLWLIGAAGAAIFLWWYYRIAKAGGDPAMAAATDGNDEMDLLVASAFKRLRDSKQHIDATQLPIIYVIGPPGSSKTTTVIHSGLEPELLSGEVIRETAVIPTRTVNLWFARQAMLVEAGGPLVLGEPQRWVRLIRALQPGKLSSALGRKQQAPRAVVLCLDCGTFLASGASEKAAEMARQLNQRLQQLSAELGINLPVYVLFTKLDQIPSFADYVGNLTNEEAAQPLGVTLPLRAAQVGVYAEEESKRLTKYFDELFYSLADHRAEFLARETVQQKLPGIYEFPRDLRKLRMLLVQFLVDLNRPSQMQANPFLRGFYFSGARPILVDDVADAALQPAASTAPADSGAGATRILNMSDLRAAAAVQAAPARVARQRKVPQWVFLTRVFNDIVLKDRAGLEASGFSTKVSFLRRVLLAAAAAVCLLVAILFVVSFLRNRSMQADIAAAGSSLIEARVEPGQLPGIDVLRRLESLREQVEMLEKYGNEGARWSMRWGLYSGDAIYRDARSIYFTRFHQIMFGSSQQALLAYLQKLPAAPAPNEDYRVAYDRLKAYLVTTSHHDKSKREFLAPLLTEVWLAGRPLDPERTALAQKQFEFYADELRAENPFSSEIDAAAVERARGYLSKFAAVRRIYQSVLDEANGKFKAIRFNQDFPGSAQAVLDPKPVQGAFTKAAFSAMQERISRFDLAAEDWVLGKQQLTSFDRGATERQLRTWYADDFVEQWRAFLRAASVVRYRDPEDAANKLALLAGNQSPLLALFSVVSTNTGVDNGDVAGAFQAPQAIVAPNADRYINDKNQAYVTGLGNLQLAMEQFAKARTDSAAMAQANNAALTAAQAARQLQLAFKLDSAGVDSLSYKLLLAPIEGARAVINPPAPPTGGMCQQVGPLFRKFPFDARAETEASVAEVNASFQPGSGALWKFYDEHLKTRITKQGGRYVLNPGVTDLSPAFLRFFNEAAAFSEIMYHGNAPQPSMALTMTLYPVDGAPSVTLDVNGQLVTGPGPAKRITWTADSKQVDLKLPLFQISSTGPWALFHFFYDADRWQLAGDKYVVERVIKSGRNQAPVISPVTGKPLTVRFDLEASGAAVLQKGYLAGMRCAK